MKTLLTALWVTQLLPLKDYVPLAGHHPASTSVDYRIYSCGHLIEDGQLISPPVVCEECGRGRLDPRIVVIVKCSCGKKLIYSANQVPKELRYRWWRHVPAPIREMR